MTRTLTWDGEKVLEKNTVDDIKRSPKDIITGLASVRGQIVTQRDSRSTSEKNIKINDKNISNLKDAEKELDVFEDRCVDLQKKKILSIIAQEGKELQTKAMTDAEETVDKDPSAYNEMQQKNLPYLNYQKAIATHPKMVEHVAPQMITKYLYMEPIFDNPFE